MPKLSARRDRQITYGFSCVSFSWMTHTTITTPIISSFFFIIIVILIILLNLISHTNQERIALTILTLGWGGGELDSQFFGSETLNPIDDN